MKLKLEMNQTVYQRIKSVLLRAAEPMDVETISERANCSDQSVRNVITKLRRECGDRLIAERLVIGGTPTMHYRMLKPVGKKLKYEAGLVVKDLWRGWVNPFTGIVPEKLGL